MVVLKVAFEHERHRTVGHKVEVGQANNYCLNPFVFNVFCELVIYHEPERVAKQREVCQQQQEEDRSYDIAVAALSLALLLGFRFEGVVEVAVNAAVEELALGEDADL